MSSACVKENMDEANWIEMMAVPNQQTLQNGMFDVIYENTSRFGTIQNEHDTSINNTSISNPGVYENLSIMFDQATGYEACAQDEFNKGEYPWQSLENSASARLAQNSLHHDYSDEPLGYIPSLEECNKMVIQKHSTMSYTAGYGHSHHDAINSMSDQAAYFRPVSVRPGSLDSAQLIECGSTACHGSLLPNNNQWPLNDLVALSGHHFVTGWPATQVSDEAVSHAVISTASLLDNVHGQALPPIPITSCDLARRRKGKNDKDGRKKQKHSNAEWMHMREYHLKRLASEKHTREEMAFELELIHHFETSAKTLGDKLRAWGPDFKSMERSRAAQALPRLETDTSSSNLAFELKPLKGKTTLTPAPGLRFRAYIHQEKIFHELDCLIKGCFDRGTKGKGWSVGSCAFISPLGGKDNLQAWRRLSADCSGIALLGEATLYNHVLFLFGKALKRCKAAAQSCDPNILIYFWTICQSLCDVRFPRRHEFVLLRVLLQHLRQAFWESLRNHAIVKFLDSLLQIAEFSRNDLRTTVGLAYWKTIHVLVDSCGIPRGHRIILNMGSHCTKHWRSKFVANPELLEPSFKVLIRSMNVHPSVRAEQKVSLLFDHIQATSKGKYNTRDLVDQTAQLWTQSADLCRERAASKRLHWTKCVQAFAFSTELIGKHHLEYRNECGKPVSPSDDRSKGFSYMHEAIEILGQGDLQCRIRAFSFSRRLGLWLKAYHGAKSAKDEKVRRHRILSHIPKTIVAVPAPQNPAGCGRRSATQARWRHEQRTMRDTLYSHLPKV